MVSCITASIDLACRARDDVNFISGVAILERADAELGCPVTIAFPSNPAPLTGELKPDAFFGLEYVSEAGPKYRFFAVEADRATEPEVTTNSQRKSWVKSLLQYRAYVEGGAYRDHLKLSSSMMVLNVTNGEARMANMMSLTKKHFPAGNSYMLFQHWEEFGGVFKPPVPRRALMGGTWERAGMESFSIQHC
jgi:hypothetical protein